jgi:hypothetical protein
MLNAGLDKRLGLHHRVYRKIKFTIPFLYSRILSLYAIFGLGSGKSNHPLRSLYLDYLIVHN